MGGELAEAAAAGEARVEIIGAGEDEKETLARLRRRWKRAESGHGTALARAARARLVRRARGKFNLRGDDIAASELAKWLKPFARPVVIVCGFSRAARF